MKEEAYLKFPREPLQIPFKDGTIHVSATPCYYSREEITAIESYISRLGYTQSLVKTGAKLIGADSLLVATEEDLTALEDSHGYSNLRKNIDGSLRSKRERVLLLREIGYEGGVATAQ